MHAASRCAGIRFARSSRRCQLAGVLEVARPAVLHCQDDASRPGHGCRGRRLAWRLRHVHPHARRGPMRTLCPDPCAPGRAQVARARGGRCWPGLLRRLALTCVCCTPSRRARLTIARSFCSQISKGWAVHFQSVHSWIGMIVVAIFAWQWLGAHTAWSGRERAGRGRAGGAPTAFRARPPPNSACVPSLQAASSCSSPTPPSRRRARTPSSAHSRSAARPPPRACTAPSLPPPAASPPRRPAAQPSPSRQIFGGFLSIITGILTLAYRGDNVADKDYAFKARPTRPGDAAPSTAAPPTIPSAVCLRAAGPRCRGRLSPPRRVAQMIAVFTFLLAASVAMVFSSPLP